MRPLVLDEWQSMDSDHMILRMFEYEASITIEHWAEIPDGFEVIFPRSCVVYLRGKGKVDRNKKLHIMFPDGKSYTYSVKVIELRKYSKKIRLSSFSALRPAKV